MESIKSFTPLQTVSSLTSSMKHEFQVTKLFIEVVLQEVVCGWNLMVLAGKLLK